MQQELHSISSLISDDIKRAGFNRDSTTLLITGNLDLSPFAHHFSLSSYPKEMTNSCILYAYDKDQDGQFDTEKSHEGYGFRLHQKAIEMRQGGGACDAGGWQDISDSEAIVINHFRFDLSENKHKLTLRIDAAVKRHPTMTYTLQRSWTLANAI
jgi:prepilin peptidase dependent protein B